MQKGERRLQNVELVVPIVLGTAAFYLGKKVVLTVVTCNAKYNATHKQLGITVVQATEYHSHKWTLYVRSVNGQDLTHILSKVAARCACVCLMRTIAAFFWPESSLKPPYSTSTFRWFSSCIPALKMQQENSHSLRMS